MAKLLVDCPPCLEPTLLAAHPRLTKKDGNVSWTCSLAWEGAWPFPATFCMVATFPLGFRPEGGLSVIQGPFSGPSGVPRTDSLHQLGTSQWGLQASRVDDPTQHLRTFLGPNGTGF